MECAEGGRRWKKIWGSPVGVQRGEEKKKCPEAKVRCRPCESEWRGGLPKSPKKTSERKEKERREKMGGLRCCLGACPKMGVGGKTRIRGVPHVGRENEGKMKRK